MLHWFADVFEKQMPSNGTSAVFVSGSQNSALTFIWSQILMVIALASLRTGLEKFIFKPFGKRLGVSDVKNLNEDNAKLEAAYRVSLDLDKKLLTFLTKRLELSEGQIKRWWSLRRTQEKPSDLAKFCESTWKSTFLFCNFIILFHTLWGKEWFWNLDLCLGNHSYESVTNDIWWCYLINCGYYMLMTITHFKDHYRNDFWQAFLHHVITIFLLNCILMSNLHRIGSVILIIHQCAEMFIEASKAMKLAKYRRLNFITSMIFVVVWTASRLVAYPTYVLRAIKKGFLSGYDTMDYIYMALLLVLMGFHLIWTWMIARSFAHFLRTKKVRDLRSSPEASDEELLKDKHE